MNFAEFARAAFALVLTLGLIGLAAVALRRFGTDATPETPYWVSIWPDAQPPAA